MKSGEDASHEVNDRDIHHFGCDPDVKRKAGRVFSSWELAEEYGFDDADGTRPHWGRHWEQAFGAPYPRADEAAYASWFGGAVEVLFDSQK